ncbi:hypothetical protein BREVNS_1216 [Brevinematales bacterium NS]|nr:hypothetical protein BREVNS_1216 [Brevinematales bacterium NS]
MASTPTGLLRRHTAGRGEGYGNISARRGLSETTGPRAMTLFQLNNPSVKRLTYVYTSPSFYSHVSAKALQLRFGGLVRKNNKRCRPGCLLHPHSGRTSPLRQRTHNRKSGPVDTERSRSGVQKKRGERTELSRVISLFIKKCGNSYSVSYVERHMLSKKL